MSRRRKQKNREAKERKADEQRIRISRSNIRTPIHQQQLSEYGYPSSQRFETYSEPPSRLMASDEARAIFTSRKSSPSFKKFKGKFKVVPKKL